jgi:hypothetical protein
MKELIFETENLKAFYATSGDARQDARIAVTFRSLIKPGRIYETGESESTIRRSGFDAVHVIPKSNRWYQYSEMPDLMEVIRRIPSTYDMVATYGLSMGGFGALQASAFLDADLSVAYSPQFSVDNTKLDFVDLGWQQKVRGATFVWDAAENISKRCRHVVVYDPRHTDAKHVAELRKHVVIEGIVFPFAGHHTWRSAKHAGIGEKLLRRALLGETQFGWARQAVRASRYSDARYFVNLWRQSRIGPKALEQAMLIDPLLAMTSLQRKEWKHAEDCRADIWAEVQTALAQLRSAGKAEEAQRVEDTLERIRRRGELEDTDG